MKNLKIIILAFIIFGFENVYADRILSTHYFDDIAISETDTVGEQKKIAFKIVINKVTQPNINEIKAASLHLSPPEIKLGEMMWTITPDMLPANSETCENEGIDSCTEKSNETGSLAGCYHSCIQYGPTFLSYDKKNQKLYLLADTIEVGQGGGPFLGFVADLKTKTIKYLKLFYGFAEGVSSPDGEYILIHGKGFLNLYNTKTNQENTIESHGVSDVRWVDDKQFSYRVYDGKNWGQMITKSI